MFATRRIQIGVAALVVGMTLTAAAQAGGNAPALRALQIRSQAMNDKYNLDAQNAVLARHNALNRSESGRRVRELGVGAQQRSGAPRARAAGPGDERALPTRKLRSRSAVLEQLRLGRRDGRRLGGLRPLPDRRRNRRRRPAVPRRAAHTGLGRRASHRGDGREGLRSRALSLSSESPPARRIQGREPLGHLFE